MAILDPRRPASLRLDSRGLEAAVAVLARRDPDLAAIVERHGVPPLWDRPPGFATLVAIVLEQQVSLASGAAAFERLRSVGGAVTAEAIARMGEDGARTAGLTRQKARYVVALAHAVIEGTLDLAAIDDAPDEDARRSLTSLLGVGPWTAEIYLLMALGRPDIWPLGDLALASALRRAKRLPSLPTAVEQLAIVEPWRPLRAVAARVLWHAYLAGER